MDLIYELVSVIRSTMPLTFWDFIDIGILWFLIYKLIRFMKESRVGGLISGLIIIIVGYLLARMISLKAVTYLLKTLMDAGLFSLLVLFQPEMRRSIEKLGHSGISGISKIGVLNPEASSTAAKKWIDTIDAICDACDDLAASCTGALIVIEMETKLAEQIATGTILNAEPTKELFGTIFFPKTPLHDGAVIIRDGMVLAAACFLPKPLNEERISKELGSRHRAAIGMSENSDAITIVVSEETGVISVAENGNLSRRFTKSDLKKYLRERVINRKSLQTDKPDEDKKPLFGRKKS